MTTTPATLVGILAEDATDCDAVDVLVRRIGSGVQFGFKKRGTKGCTKLHRILHHTVANFCAAGCRAIVVVRDLDRNAEDELREHLEGKPCYVPRLICIPAEELEAWFWSDPDVLQIVANGKRVRAHEEPHLITSPKEKLVRLSIDKRKRPRYSTNDNKDLAARLNISLCARRCDAFGALVEFVRGIAAPGTTQSTAAARRRRRPKA